MKCLIPFAISLVCASVPVVADNESPDRVLLNGKVITVDAMLLESRRTLKLNLESENKLYREFAPEWAGAGTENSGQKGIGIHATF